MAPSPVISLANRACAANMDLASARPLSVDDEQPEQQVDIDDDTPCVSDAGMHSTYALFRLPDSGPAYSIDVSSLAQGETLFAPRLLLLDVHGGIVRIVAKNDFMFRGSTLKATLFMNAGNIARERYLAVTSAPEAVGTQDSRVVMGQGGGYVSGGAGVGAYIYWGTDTVQGLTYTHNGQVSVSARVLKPLQAGTN